jgi:hypothetical protein
MKGGKGQIIVKSLSNHCQVKPDRRLGKRPPSDEGGLRDGGEGRQCDDEAPPPRRDALEETGLFVRELERGHNEGEEDGRDDRCLVKSAKEALFIPRRNF